jgi:hypothetical protein
VLTDYCGEATLYNFVISNQVGVVTWDTLYQGEIKLVFESPTLGEETVTTFELFTHFYLLIDVY